MTETGKQNANMIQSVYNDVPLKTLLKGYRKRIIELINSNSEVSAAIKNSLRNDRIIVGYPSRSSAISNIESLRNMWGTLLDLTKYICNQLATEKELATIGGNNTTKTMCNDISALADKIKNYLSDNMIPKESDNDYDADGYVNMNSIDENASIGKYISGLDGLTPYYGDNEDKVDWKFVITYGIFKQIYTQVYCTLCDYNKYARLSGASVKRSKIINSKVNTEHSLTGYILTSAKDVSASLSASKLKNVIGWINSRWDWRIPICCIDKMIIALDGLNNKATYVTRIPAEIYTYLPTVIYFSRKCKSSPTAYISNIDIVKLFSTNTVAAYVRCSKLIKEDKNGYYIDVITSTRKINFGNLSKYNTMTSDVWNHVIVHNGNTYTPEGFIETMKNGIAQTQQFQEN